MAEQKRYVSAYLGGANWVNITQAYVEAGEASLPANLAYVTMDASITYYGIPAASEIYTSLKLYMPWKTGTASGDDQWGADYSVNDGSTWETFIAMGTNRNTGYPITPANVSLPADTDLTKIRVRINLTKVGPPDKDTLYTKEIYTVGIYPTAAFVERGARTRGASAATLDSVEVEARTRGLGSSYVERGGRTRGRGADSVERGARTKGYAWSVCGSRVAMPDFASYSPDIRDWIAAEDTDVTDNSEDYLILAIALEKVATPASDHFRPDLYWRNITDGGSWTKISTSSGEIRLPTTDVTDLDNGTSVDEAETGCTSATGSYWAGYETEGEATYPINVLGNDAASWGESHCAIDMTNALEGKEYGFRLDDKDDLTGIVPGSIVTITTAISSTLDSVERGARTRGRDSDSVERGARTWGKGVDSVEVEARTRGLGSDNVERGARTRGQDSDSVERGARTRGKDYSYKEINARVRGKGQDSVERGARTRGLGTDYVERSGRTRGRSESYVERGGRTRGKITYEFDVQASSTQSEVGATAWTPGDGSGTFDLT